MATGRPILVDETDPLPELSLEDGVAVALAGRGWQSIADFALIAAQATRPGSTDAAYVENLERLATVADAPNGDGDA